MPGIPGKRRLRRLSDENRPGRAAVCAHSTRTLRRHRACRPSLTEALVERRHEVTLFAAGGTRTSATLHATTPAPLWEMGISDPLACRVLQIEELVARSAAFDLIHSHFDYLPWIAGGRLRAPVITTMHSRLDLPELRPLFSCMTRW